MGIDDDNFSEDIKLYIAKMCHYNVGKRLKIKDFFKFKFFCPEIKDHFEKLLTEKEENQPLFPSKILNYSKCCLKSILVNPKTR